jgi:hypothetical protein
VANSLLDRMMRSLGLTGPQSSGGSGNRPGSKLIAHFKQLAKADRSLPEAATLKGRAPSHDGALPL